MFLLLFSKILLLLLSITRHVISAQVIEIIKATSILTSSNPQISKIQIIPGDNLYTFLIRIHEPRLIRASIPSMRHPHVHITHWSLKLVHSDPGDRDGVEKRRRGLSDVFGKGQYVGFLKRYDVQTRMFRVGLGMSSLFTPATRDAESRSSGSGGGTSAREEYKFIEPSDVFGLGSGIHEVSVTIRFRSDMSSGVYALGLALSYDDTIMHYAYFDMAPAALIYVDRASETVRRGRVGTVTVQSEHRSQSVVEAVWMAQLMTHQSRLLNRMRCAIKSVCGNGFGLVGRGRVPGYDYLSLQETEMDELVRIHERLNRVLSANVRYFDERVGVEHLSVDEFRRRRARDEFVGRVDLDECAICLYPFVPDHDDRDDQPDDHDDRDDRDDEDTRIGMTGCKHFYHSRCMQQLKKCAFCSKQIHPY